VMQERVPALLRAVGESMGTPLPADAITMIEPDVFRWIDDGKATISVQLSELAPESETP
jgi:hypothetical protein